MNRIKLLPIEYLKPHEKVNPRNLAKVKAEIMSADCFTEPIVVDRRHYIILDGHHRTKILKSLGYSKIPVLLVDYLDEKIKVVSRRKNRPVKKESIIYNALLGKLFPYKTSRHLIPNRPKHFKINLNKLT